MNGTFRRSASGITGPAGQAAAGSQAPTPESEPGFGWSISIRSELSFHLWEAKAKLRHLFGRHTFIDIEDWTKESGIDVITIIGQECWLCPARI